MSSVRREKRETERSLSPTGDVLTQNGTGETLLTNTTPPDKDNIEQRLYESEQRFRFMFEQANVGISFTSLGGYFKQVNDRLCEIVGYSREELLGQNFSFITHPSDITKSNTYLNSATDITLLTNPLEKRYIRKDGSVVWVSLTVSLLHDAAGQPLEYMTLIQDISKRRAMELEREQLLAQEQAARATAERTAEKLTILQSVTDTALAHLSQEDLLHELLKRITDILHVDAAGVLLPTTDNRYLKVRAAIGLEQEVIDMIALPIAANDGWHISPVYEPFIVDDLSSMNVLSNVLRKHFHALMTAPLLVEGQIIGLIAVGSIQTRQFTHEEAQLLQRVADRIALAIDHIRLYQAEREARAQATLYAQQQSERASQLEAVFASLTDNVIVYDKWGHVLYTNSSVSSLLPFYAQPEYHMASPEKRVEQYTIYDEQGHLLSSEQLPVNRILKKGEILNDASEVDMVVQTPEGHNVYINVTGSPIRETNGSITGGVLISRNVTERRSLERRTHEALDGLLEMAEALVRLSDSAEDLRAIGQRIAELTCRVLDCQRVGVQVIEERSQIVHPLAVVGLSPEQEREWWIEQAQQEQSLRDNPMPELVERLRANEVLVLDMTEPPFNAAPNPYHIKTMLIAPMCVSDRLVGLLTLDYNGTDHRYTTSETALASAVAKLAAMVLERQRLLREQAESAARELALREANSRMEEFLGIASHELRTPLTTIKANVQLAQRRLKAITQQAEQLPSEVNNKVGNAQDMLTRAERQIGVLNRLVGDLIDISRIQTGKLQLHLRQEPFDLSQIVIEMVQEQRKATPERTINLQIITEQPVLVVADPDRIAQVLTNYLSNALKYSESDKPVDVFLELSISPEQPPEARVSVRDQGPGLSLQEQQRIWECFYQADSVKVLSGSGVGLGLGLYISQTIIQRHHGHVGIESHISRGSTFWFALPLIQDDHETSSIH